MKTLKKVFMIALYLLPFGIGTAGFLQAGLMITDALYASFALHFASRVADGYNLWIEIARWTAPLVTATTALRILTAARNKLVWWIQSLPGDSVAVYSDVPITVGFPAKNWVVRPGESFQSRADDHVILFSSDRKGFAFYEDHLKGQEKKRVFLGIREFDATLIKEQKGLNIFDINAAIARTLWKEIALWKQDRNRTEVVIWGEGILAQVILSHGLLMNLYGVDQQVIYHVVDEEPLFRERHPQLTLYNRDEIRYHSPKEDGVWKTVRDADLCIVAEELSADMLQTLAVNSKKLYAYTPEADCAANFIAFGNVEIFGKNEEILTDDNIRRQKTVQAAIDIHEAYVRSCGGGRRWNELDGFTKNSNVSTADFQEVLMTLPDSVPEEELAELEHIRWCRFHLLHYWKWGEQTNKENRIHSALVPYVQLSEADREKNRQIVRRGKRKVQ